MENIFLIGLTLPALAQYRANAHALWKKGPKSKIKSRDAFAEADEEFRKRLKELPEKGTPDDWNVLKGWSIGVKGVIEPCTIIRAVESASKQILIHCRMGTDKVLKIEPKDITVIVPLPL